MRRGTTPTITVTVDGDVTEYTLYLAFKAGSETRVKTGEDLDVSVVDGSTVITCKLTQADTLAMTAKTCEVQVRAVKDSGATALATDIGAIPVKRILQQGVLDE